jgi:hypothetical protein
MPEIISCPACQRKLQVPEEYFGQTVQCPECKHTFTAGPASPAPVAAPTEPVRVPEWDKPPERQRRDVDETEQDRPRRQRFEDEEEEEYARRPRRRYVAPHRGSMILTFGILSIVLFPCSTPIFGPLAWIMGSSDLAQIRAASMDPDGEGLTQAGRILGIITTCLMLFIFISACGFSLVRAAF